MAALGDDLRLLALRIDGAARLQDGGGRLDREADHEILAGRKSAQDPTGLVREEFRRAVVPDPHLIGVLLAGEGGGLEARADLHRLDGVDRHHGLGEVGVELVIDGLAQAGGHAGRHDLDHRAAGRAGLAHPVQVLAPGLRRLGVRCKEGVPVHLRPVEVFPVDAVGAHLHQTAAQGEGLAQEMRQQLARDAACGDTHRRFPCGGPAAAARIADAVLLPVGIVRVAGPELGRDVAVVLGTLILVLDHQTDGRAGRLALVDAGDDPHLIGFLALGGVARLAGLAPVEPALKVGLAQGNQRGHAVHHAADLRPVAFAPGGEAEGLAEGITRHSRAPDRARPRLRPWGRDRRATRGPRWRRRPPSCRRRDSRNRRGGPRR